MVELKNVKIQVIDKPTLNGYIYSNKETGEVTNLTITSVNAVRDGA